MLISHPERSVTGFKRLLGRSYQEIGNFVNGAHYKIIERTGNPIIQIPLQSGSREFQPTEVLAFMIHELKIMAEEFIGEKIKEAVVTVPAGFNDSQRAAFREAANITALDVVRIVNEPTAASLAYKLDKDYRQEKFALVYSLDGTAFDATVVYIEDGVFEIFGNVRSEDISSSNDVSSSKLAHQHSDSQRTSFQEKNNVMRGFSAQTKDQVPLLNTDARRDEVIAEEEFLNSFNADQALQVIDQALREGNLTIYDITDIVPSGDSSRIPKLRSLLLDHFPSTLPVHEDIDPRLITTYGAAIQGSVLHDDGHMSVCCVVDVTLWQLGIETAGGIMSPLVKRGTLIPTKKSLIFTTTIDNQTSVAVTVFKGQRDFVAKNTKIGSLELDELIPAPRGVPELEVTFMVDYNRNLNVSLTERGSNKTTSLFIENSALEPYTDLENGLIETHLEEWERYEFEERLLRDAIQKRIVQGEDQVLGTTKGIIERALPGIVGYRESIGMTEHVGCIDGCSWWDSLRSRAYASLNRLLVLMRW
ncbi:hypothetical protein DPSP01_000986 [Paraphaeosphaeria sporulosa]